MPRPSRATEGEQYEQLKAVAAGMALVKAYRYFGHRAARLDPLGSEPAGDPALDPGPLGLTPENMRTVPAELMRIYVPGETLADALPHLQETYSGTIAYEVEHIGSHEERVWLRRVIESGEHRRPMEAEDQVALLERLISVETLERFLHKAYLGQKRFSIEGLDTMVPMLDVIIGDAADQGARKVMIGMAHRGRLNVLAHVVGVSYEAILAEFEAGRAGGEAATAPKGGLDDVKYHLGAEGGYLTADDEEVRVVLSPNPSHLEAVDPVIEGRTRAEQTDRSRPDPHHQPGLDPAAAHPWRRRLRRTGRGGRDPEPRAAGRLQHRRHGAPDREQPGRLHHRSRARPARPTTPPTSRRASTHRSSTSTPTTRRRASRRPAWR